MAYRLKLSRRAILEIGEAYEWYEEQLPGLGMQFLGTLDNVFALVVRSPGLYAETQRGVHRALLAHFPYSVFYAIRGEDISILGVIHTSRHPRLWPRE